MGNDQSRSSSAGQDQDTQEKPPDYYQLLQIDEDATDDEIKVSDGVELHLASISNVQSQRSYRKLAVSSIARHSGGAPAQPRSCSTIRTRTPIGSKRQLKSLQTFSRHTR